MEKKIKGHNRLFLFCTCFSVFYSYFISAQKIEISEKGVLINSITIKNETDIIRALGEPDKKVSFSDSIKGGYWNFNSVGLTIYFTVNSLFKKAEISISTKNFKGELYIGKSKLYTETHIYKLLQYKEFDFLPVEIEPYPNEDGNFLQLIDANCFGRSTRFFYDRPDAIGLISLNLY